MSSDEASTVPRLVHSQPAPAPPASSRDYTPAYGKQLGEFVDTALRDAKGPHLQPSADLVMIAQTFCEAFEQQKDELSRFGLWTAFSTFVDRLSDAHIPVLTDARRDRALEQRRLGELAESRGHVTAAIYHFELALQNDARVGCKKRLQQLLAIRTPS